MVRRSAQLIVALATALVLAVGTADAGTFIAMPPQDLAASSIASVVATVEGVHPAQAADGRIYTLVDLLVEEVLHGEVPGARLTLKERGGAIGGTSQVVFGAPQYRTGERVVVFLTTWSDGALRTNHLALGKFTVTGGGAAAVAEQTLGAESVVLGGGMLGARPLAELAKEARTIPPATAKASVLARPPNLTPAPAASAPFMLLGPARFFEPDEGQPLLFLIDERGDSALGFDTSRTAIDSALSVWTNVEGAGIALGDAGVTESLTAECDGIHRIRFDDPDDEIPPPFNCAGTLGVGGFCTISGDTKTFSNVTFARALTASLTFADGFGACPEWTACNVAEIATHEIGHAIGIDHSSEDPGEADPILEDATMYFQAHFDGRCAGVRADDRDAVSFIYPTEIPPTITTSSPLPPGVVLTPYNLRVLATGGTGQFTWSLVAGGFPGLTFSSDGRISGSPSAIGNGFFRVRATDSAGDSHVKTLRISVATTLPSATPTRTRTATVPPTATRTETPTPPATPTPSRTPTPSITPSPSRTGTTTRTNTPGPSPTRTATPSPTASRAVPTPTPTDEVVAGDANCDGAVSAPDVSALLEALADDSVEVCDGGDANDDGFIDDEDIAATIEALFGGS